MNRKRYGRTNNNILRFIKNRIRYGLNMKQVACVLVILLIIFILKLLNNSISTNIIQIIDKGINYEFSIRDDGNRILGYSKQMMRISQDALSVFRTGTSHKHAPPIKGSIYNPFGETVYLDGRTSFNEGVDIIPSDEKEPIAIRDGMVKKVEDRDTKGYFVTIEHEDMTTVYGYLISAYVSKGDRVKEGDRIGSLGTNKDGNKYLHFQVWVDGEPVNPTNYIEFQKKGWFSTLGNSPFSLSWLDR
ncbi:MAG: M23 family metallopeptidase [Tissierellia bacterium]|nr:M23 family metallopeptidase [Tissierellia bacterium]